MTETIQLIRCCEEDLIAIHHAVNAANRAATSEVAIVMIVGGAQYRVGAHRLYVQLARHLAANGVPVLRFDCRGMGDSGGEPPGFEHIQPDIAAAIERLQTLQPQLKAVLLWGLCDGASAALLCATQLPLVKGLILVNPYLDSQRSQARVMLRQYYRRRLFSRDLWRKVFAGAFSPRASWRGLIGFWRQRNRDEPPQAGDLQSRLRQGLVDFAGEVNLLIAANDLTAQAFMDWVRVEREKEKQQDKQQDKPFSSISVNIISDADHTFTYHAQRQQLMQLSLEIARRCRP